jgi:hypothetical protein
MPTLRPATQLAEDWMFLVLLMVVAAFAWAKAMYPGKIIRLWQSLVNVRMMRQVIREEPNSSVSAWILNVSYYLVSSLFLYLFLKHYSITIWGIGGIALYGLLVVILLCTYVIKSLAPYVVQLLSARDNGLVEYTFSIHLTNRALVIPLFILALFAAYLPLGSHLWALHLGIGIWAFALVYRLLRSAAHALQSGVPTFYIFFYICTLEILPVLVCVKALRPFA